MTEPELQVFTAGGLIEIDIHTPEPIILDPVIICGVTPLLEGEYRGRKGNTLINMRQDMTNDEYVIVMSEYTAVRDAWILLRSTSQLLQ